MNQVYTIGETLFDIILKDGDTKAGRPGGAMLNTSVSLGRFKIPVSFISEYGNDPLGHFIDEFLLRNNVNTDFSFRYSSGKTALSIAMLDEENNATYSFYKMYPQERLRVGVPEINENDILLFGSSYALYPEIKVRVKAISDKAKEQNAIIIYDPNIRSAFKDIEGFNASLAVNIAKAEILRCSDEDIVNSLGIETANDFYKVIKARCPILIYTKGSKGVSLRTPVVEKDYDVPKIEPVSTISAGDNFNAGIIYSLIKNNIAKSELNNLPVEKWDEIINTGIEFATHACMSFDNYISKDFVKNLKKKNA